MSNVHKSNIKPKNVVKQRCAYIGETEMQPPGKNSLVWFGLYEGTCGAAHIHFTSIVFECINIAMA